jgi:hypothetical protein
MNLNEDTFSRPPAAPAAVFDPDALTRALRIAGAVLVVASASTLMLQHWQAGDDLMRYGMLVGQSLLLAAAAYFVGLTVREGQSARTLLALVLATIPVSFTVLGGLVYSQFSLEPLRPLPHYASWIAPTPLSAILAVIATLIVLVPLAVVSFVALARKEARVLTLSFCAANALLLLPVREPVVMVALAGVAFLGLLHIDTSRFAGAAQLDTLEGKLARVMPFAPPLILLGRSVHLYHCGAAFAGGVLLSAAAALWLLLARTESALKRDLGACSAALLVLAGWALCWSQIAAEQHGAHASLVLLLGLPPAALWFVASARAVAARRLLIDLGTLLGLLTAASASIIEHGTLAAFCCIALGVAVAVWGAAVKGRVRIAGGVLVALWGLGLQVWLAVNGDSWFRWVSLTAVGILMIVGAAYLERHRARIALLWQGATGH